LKKKWLKNLKTDKDYFKKKFKSLNKKKIVLILIEILIGSTSAKSSSTLSVISPEIAIPIASTSTLLTPLSMLITTEYI